MCCTAVSYTHLVKCGGCGNHCQLTVNTFADGRKYISGNRCDKPVTGKSADDSLNPVCLLYTSVGIFFGGDAVDDQITAVVAVQSADNI